MKLPLGENKLTGVKRVWHGKTAMGDRDEFAVETIQNVDDILAVAKEQYKATDGQRFNDHMTHMGLIPNTVFARLQLQARREADEGGMEERLLILCAEWFNENSDFKTFHGSADLTR